MPPITLTTDFGTRDHYVGAMKGVIRRLAPHTEIIDITHEVEPQNIIHTAFILRRIIEWYPTGTVHVAVVDPGVGSERRIIAGRYSGQIVIAPDNGIISLIHKQLRLEEIYAVENERFFLRHVSQTFHGRDIIAPVAARVATGVRLSQLGRRADDVEILEVATPKKHDPAGLMGCVLYVDHFGNLITNISHSLMVEAYRKKKDLTVYIDGRRIGPVRDTYSDVPIGEPVAIVGSSAMLEISINCGRADQVLNARTETPVDLR
jgi:S-adenosyl-L-methionine hydrolase (adenosine-forming)